MRGEPYWDRIAPRYDGFYQSAWALHEDEVLKQELQKSLRDLKGKRVLDIGCGTGLGYRLLHELDSELEYVGVDASTAMLHEFNTRFPYVATLHG